MRELAIQFGSAALGNFDESLKREWLETNGLGGFASSTVLGINTRRYHGLLTAATKPPVGRMVLLSKFEETLLADGQRYELSANCYPGAVHPHGFEFLKSFALDPYPRFAYEAGGIEITKTVFMVHGENTTVIEYSLRGSRACTLELRPLIAFRDYHSLTHANVSLNGEIVVSPDCVKLSPYSGVPELYLSHNGASAETSGNWYYSFEYTAERERGLDFQEDLFNPCVLRFELRPGETARVVASIEPHRSRTGATDFASEELRRAAITAKSPVDDGLVTRLVAAADQYIVDRGEFKTIIAGYHWFSDWGP